MTVLGLLAGIVVAAAVAVVGWVRALAAETDRRIRAQNATEHARRFRK
jgi:hypothetical protein